MYHSFKLGFHSRIISSTALTAAFLLGAPGEARAFNPLDVIGPISKIREGVSWLNCHSGPGGYCPPSEAYQLARQTIDEVTNVVVATRQGELMAMLDSLALEADMNYRNQHLMTDDDERFLVDSARDTFFHFDNYLQSVVVTNSNMVESAYRLAAPYTLMAALVQSIGRAAIERGQIPIDWSWIEAIRQSQQATSYALIGAESLFYTCPGDSGPTTRVNTQQNFNQPLLMKKLAPKFSNFVFHAGGFTCADCNMSKLVASPSASVCTRNSNGCFLGICRACLIYNNDSAIYWGLPMMYEKMDADPVVAVLRSSMAYLAGAGINWFYEPYCGQTFGRLRTDSGTFNDRNFNPGDADWDPGKYKAECHAGYSLSGLSQEPSTGNAHAALCQLPDDTVPSHWLSGAYVATLSVPGDVRYHERLGDWDPGYWKLECPAYAYAAGASQDPVTHRFQSLRCGWAGGTVAADGQGCYRRLFDSSLAAGVGDWDVGYLKAECGRRELGVGVSVDPSSGAPHAMLCCPQG
jgi:hypothetical protein